ncbi:MAG: hypothetical protein ABW148_10740 [Sedimenticola sp.]
MSQIVINNLRITGLVAALVLLLIPFISLAESEVAVVEAEVSVEENTAATLKSFVDLRKGLKRDIKALNKQLRAAQSDAEKKGLQLQLDQRDADLQATTRNFEDIAAGVDISSLRHEEEQAFDFQQEVLGLLRPALDEMKSMTAHVRQKSELKEKIAYFEQRLPVIEQAVSNTHKLLQESKDKVLNKSLKETVGAWEKQQAFMQSELQAAQLQLDKLVASETSISAASQSYLKSFFQKRGLYLTVALLTVFGIMLLSRLSYSAMQRYLPGFRKLHRSFRVRLLELLHRILTVLLVIVGPMVVFYSVEDWMLFSLGILLLIGIAWTLRQALPRYWKQIQLFLNIGPVREGERIMLEGLPWKVKQINVYSTLVNPVADISQRVPIEDLAGLKSRPYGTSEPWFPCKLDDWVILSDGVRGKVSGISPEMVQLVQRGGVQVSYQMGDFLAASPRNLATNFRIKELLGISYSLQKESTSTIPATLHDYIQQRLQQEGYGEQLLNLRVEFAQANSSSLDLVVMADFDGELGDLYNRLRRAIQRFCVDACSEYGWEIPFPQMTLHGAIKENNTEQ